MLFVICIEYYVLYCLVFVYHLNVSLSSLITWVGEERAVFSAIDYLYFSCVCLKGFLWLFAKGCVIILWHSLCLTYSY